MISYQNFESWQTAIYDYTTNQEQIQSVIWFDFWTMTKYNVESEVEGDRRTGHERQADGRVKSQNWREGRQGVTWIGEREASVLYVCPHRLQEGFEELESINPSNCYCVVERRVKNKEIWEINQTTPTFRIFRGLNINFDIINTPTTQTYNDNNTPTTQT